MPLMYHKDAKEPVNVSSGNIATMENRGWSLGKPSEKQNTATAKKETAAEAK